MWTSQGWQKKPRRMRQVKSVPKPNRRRKRRVRRISSAVRKSARPVEAEARQVAKERDGTDSPLTAAPKQGSAHYLAQQVKEVHLYGPKQPPSWLFKLPLDVRFVFHNSRALFATDAVTNAGGGQSWDLAKGEAVRGANPREGFVVQSWGQWDWPLILSAPEHALFELLDELPARESLHQVDKLFEGLTNLSPRRLTTLFADCRSVKVKRLFFFFAARHGHAWLKRIDRSKVNLGSASACSSKAAISTRRRRSPSRRISMAFAESYRRQVALLMRTLPQVAEEAASRSKAGPQSIYLFATCRAFRSISI